MAASSAERLPPRALTLELRQRSHDRRSSPLRPRSGPLVDTRNQQTPVSELLCRLGASVADGGTPGPALSHTVERGTARAHAAHLCCLRSVPAAHSSSTSRLRGVRTTATGAPSHITPLAHVHPRIHSLTLS
mmetsp:Transcript_43827/g.145087  ORF Transcript_43827/g.145087 Transcript_43827/m.145087 type:complete len:132 (+) Transcript_43827:231-626(+)